MLGSGQHPAPADLLYESPNKARTNTAEIAPFLLIAKGFAQRFDESVNAVDEFARVGVQLAVRGMVCRRVHKVRCPPQIHQMLSGFLGVKIGHAGCDRHEINGAVMALH